MSKYPAASMRETKAVRKKARWARLRKEFETCTYPNQGAYIAIPTIRSTLKIKELKE